MCGLPTIRLDTLKDLGDGEHVDNKLDDHDSVQDQTCNVFCPCLSEKLVVESPTPFRKGNGENSECSVMERCKLAEGCFWWALFALILTSKESLWCSSTTMGLGYTADGLP